MRFSLICIIIIVVISVFFVALFMINNANGSDYNEIGIFKKALIKIKHPTFTSIGDVKDNYGRVMVEVENSRYGYVNQMGMIIVPPIYESLSRDLEKDNPVISIYHYDATGKFFHHIYSAKFQNIHFVVDKKIAVEDNSFKRVSGFDYDWVDYETGYAKRNGEYGTIDDSGIFHIKEELKGFLTQGNDFDPIVMKAGKVGMINENLELTIPAIYDSIESVGETLFIVKRQEQYGILTNDRDSNTEIIYYDKITPIYQFVNQHPRNPEDTYSKFSEIGKGGEIKLEFYELNVSNMSVNYWSYQLFCFKVEKEGQSFYIGIDGKEILDTKEVEDVISQSNRDYELHKEENPFNCQN